MSRQEILERLNIDEDYYGEFGQQFLSNSDIGKLIKNPEEFHKPSPPNINLLLGAAFHTMILEPEKMDRYKVIDSSTRYTKKYKEETGGEMALLTSDMQNLEAMQERMYNNDHIMSILQGPNVEYEVPAIMEICGEWWKGKADAINHDDKLIIDIKTTSDINNFERSAKRYNYDSQAFIYRSLFGEEYEMVFIVIDKKTKQLCFAECTDSFYQSGKEKVVEAVYAYRMYFKDQKDNQFDWDNYLDFKTLI